MHQSTSSIQSTTSQNFKEFEKFSNDIKKNENFVNQDINNQNKLTINDQIGIKNKKLDYCRVKVSFQIFFSFCFF